MAGGFAFDIVDRFSGSTLGTPVPEWAQHGLHAILTLPMAWWFLNMGVLVSADVWRALGGGSISHQRRPRA